MLVVIAIIGVLIALLLPAVQHVREVGRRTQCNNHLRQIALGMHEHHSQFQSFPSAGDGWWQSRKKASSGMPHLSRRQDWGAFYQVLPYIEQKAVYQNPSNAEAAAAVIKIYFCPTRRPPAAYPGAAESGLPYKTLRGGLDYAGNGGFGPSTFPSSASFKKQTGVIIPRLNNEKVGLGDIRDGTSATLLLGERNFNRRRRGQTLNQWDENNGYVCGWDWDTTRWSYSAPAPDRADNSHYDRRFGGPHAFICNFVFCDGSTRPLAYTINLTVFRQLTGRNDGKSPDVRR